MIAIRRISVLAAATLLLIVSGPRALQAQYAPSPAIVSATCLDPNDDLALRSWAYDSGFLVCLAADQDAEGTALYKESPIGSGQFSLVIGVGGIFQASDLVLYGVPADVADRLFNSILQQEQLQP